MGLIAAVVIVVAIGAGWDALRRYFDVARFNQKFVDELQLVRADAEVLRQQLSDVKQRMALQTGAVGARNPLRGVTR